VRCFSVRGLAARPGGDAVTIDVGLNYSLLLSDLVHNLLANVCLVIAMGNCLISTMSG
jgi:hypothetical protein